MAHPVKSYNNILLPFSFELWLVIIATAVVFSMIFYIIHLIYETNFSTEMLHRAEGSKINFLLFTMSKLTEPDPLPWFTRKWSTGKIVTLLWTVWALIMVLCYNSNLRANLTSPQYEKSLDTIQDVKNNDGINWFPKNYVPVEPFYLEKTGQTNGPLYQISKKAYAAGTSFLSAKHGGVSPQALQVKMITKDRIFLIFLIFCFVYKILI